jgi:predicted dehydrogenase
MEKKIKLGIIGIGNMGSGHVKTIMKGDCPEIELAAVADTNPDRIEWFKREISTEIPTFSDAIEMLDSGVIDSCLVAVPHYDHPKYAIECMNRGIHVLVEKPAGVYTKQVKEMNAVSEAHPEVVFGLMFNQRTNPMYRKIRELIQSGRFGQIRRTIWIVTNWYRHQAYYNSGGWRATWKGEGGGVLSNQCPHQLDLWQWMCGMPVKVDCHMHFGKWHDIEVEDDVSTYVEYPNGATGVFIASTGDAHGTNRLEIQMDKGRIIADEKRFTVLEYEMTEQEFSAQSSGTFGTLKAHELQVETEGHNTQHMGVMNAFAGAILHGTPLIADGKEGINEVMLANSMYLSAFLGKPVELPIDDDLYYEELQKKIATSKDKENVVTVYGDTAGSYAGTTK